MIWDLWWHFSGNRNERLLFKAGHQGDNRALKKLDKIDQEQGGTKWVDDALRRRKLTEQQGVSK